GGDASCRESRPDSRSRSVDTHSVEERKMNKIRPWHLAASLALAGTFGPLAQGACAATAAQLNADGQAALNRLYSHSDRAVRYRRGGRAGPAFPTNPQARFFIRRPPR